MSMISMLGSGILNPTDGMVGLSTNLLYYQSFY